MRGKKNIDVVMIKKNKKKTMLTIFKKPERRLYLHFPARPPHLRQNYEMPQVEAQPQQPRDIARWSNTFPSPSPSPCVFFFFSFSFLSNFLLPIGKDGEDHDAREEHYGSADNEGLTLSPQSDMIHFIAHSLSGHGIHRDPCARGCSRGKRKMKAGRGGQVRVPAAAEIKKGDEVMI